MDYNVILELGPYDEDVIDALLDGVEALGLVGSRTPWGSGQVTMTVSADSVDGALSYATGVVEAAGGVSVRGAEVMTTEDFDMRLGVGSAPMYVPEVAEALGVSRQWVLELIHKGELPAKRAGRQFEVPEGAVRRYLKEKSASPC